MHVQMYQCVCTHVMLLSVRVWLRTYGWMSVFVFAYMRTCMHACVWRYIGVREWECVHNSRAWMRMHESLCTRAHARVHVYECAWATVRSQVYLHECTCASARSRVCVVSLHTYAWVSVRSQICVPEWVCMSRRARVRVVSLRTQVCRVWV